ncbi:MAG TPA: AraC family transcriptional regulator [Gammaproteobacteria bacterium]|nr:AraC family transcriptional regulator [Gammaproteobacteria bacterium]
MKSGIAHSLTTAAITTANAAKSPPGAPSIFTMHNRFGVGIAEIHCAVDHIDRTPVGIRRDDAEYLFLLCQREGTMGLTHTGNDGLLQPREIVLMDSTRPAKMHFSSKPVSFLSAHLPRSRFLQEHGMPDIGRKIGVDHPLHASLFNMMTSSTEHSPASSDHLLLDLVALSFDSRPALPDATRMRDKYNRYELICSVVDQNLSRADLCVDALATMVCLSRRQLQREFQDHDTTFTQFIQGRRLNFVAESLRQAVYHRRCPTISKLAYLAGFGDLSHLNRVFRDRYGLSPRNYFKQQLQYAETL